MSPFRKGMLWLKLLLALVLIMNTYFIYIILKERDIQPNISVVSVINIGGGNENEISLNKQTAAPKKKRHLFSSSEASHKILQVLHTLDNKYKDLNRKFLPLLRDVASDLEQSIAKPDSKVWELPYKWISSRYVYPDKIPELGSIFRFAKRSRITNAETTKKGTQLKMLFTLEGGQKAFYKPQWYARDDVIPGAVYSGKDRHNAEIAAFHLNRLLGLNTVPLVVGRRINLKREVLTVASLELKQTFFKKAYDLCFYGKCYYCKPDDPVCAMGNAMEGALVLHLPENITLYKYRHPWQRTYKEGAYAQWELNHDYCDKVKSRRGYSSGPRLLDLISTSVFDFLIDNGDRHHYEVMGNATDAPVLLIDNGKSFGNPAVDHLDILAPLYQCCIIRTSLWTRLLQLSGSALSQSLRELSSYDALHPLLTEPHLEAVDRRVLRVFAAVQWCVQRKGKENVLV